MLLSDSKLRIHSPHEIFPFPETLSEYIFVLMQLQAKAFGKHYHNTAVLRHGLMLIK